MSARRDLVTNTSVLAQAGMPSLFAILSQRLLRWLGQMCRMKDSRILQDLLYGQLASGSCPTGRPAMRFKDVCKRDLKTCGIQQAELQPEALNHTALRKKVKEGIKSAKEKKRIREGRKENQHNTRGQSRSKLLTASPSTDYISRKCRRRCESRIELFSHSRCCSETKCEIVSQDRRLLSNM